MPKSLPQPALDSMNWSPAFEDVLRNTVGKGFKSRPLTSKDLEQFTCTLYVDAAQLQMLLDFWRITCRKVLPFYWWDWRWPSLTNRYATYAWMSKPTHSQWGSDMYQADLTLLVKETYEGDFLLDFYDSQVWPTT